MADYDLFDPTKPLTVKQLYTINRLYAVIKYILDNLDSGSVSINQIEKNLGTLPAYSGNFNFIDATILSTDKLLITQAPGPYTGKGDRADEAEMDIVNAVAFANNGSADVYWTCQPKSGPVSGNFKFVYIIG